MFEFSSMEPHTLDYSGAKLACSTVARLWVLAGIAKRLQKAGRSVWMTMTGLAFDPGDLIDWEEDPDWEEEPAEVVEALAEFGIHEGFSRLVGKRGNELPD